MLHSLRHARLLGARPLGGGRRCASSALSRVARLGPPLGPVASRRLAAGAPPPPRPPGAPGGRAAQSAAPGAPGVPGGGGATAAIVEVDTASFEALVVKASLADPPVGGAVIVDAYADWCGPCKSLTPKLERLVLAQRGAVRLAKLNVDNNPELAQSLQIKSLPTVLLVHKGKLVDSFTGALADAQLVAFVQRAAELGGGAASAERALADAAVALEAGELERAQALYSALGQLPEHAADAAAGLALCAVRAGDGATARTLAATLVEHFKADAQRPLVRQALAQVELLVEGADADGADGADGSVASLRARVAAELTNLEAKQQLATRLVATGEQAEAIELCIEIIKQDKAWNEGAGKVLLMKIFDSLGNGHALTKRGRRKLANLLFN
ncbi:hypothetical protein KFE25_004727 [Diacronema lutheri]|uniref:Thioredoxin domain-containing protein n=2 Tax=Diacronema lutheri TaxID=2081491 RepID=A0A8J5XC46_DIALT|nr:hypothetical protein KFE25_004727 [Diacronema lutheri]